MGLLLAGFYRPVYTVLGYLAIYFTYNPNAWWVITIRSFFPRPSLVAVLFLGAVALVHARKMSWSVSRRELEIYLFLAACWLSTTVFGVHLGDENWEYLFKLTKTLVFIFLLIRIVNSIEDFRLLLRAFIFSALFLAYEAHLVTTGGRVDTIGGIDFCEANGFAAFLSIGIVFSAFRFLETSWFKKALYVAGIALMANAIILTQSRAVFIGLIAAVPYVLFRSPPKRFKQILVCLVLGAIMFFSLMDSRFLERMDTISSSMETAQAGPAEKRSLDRTDFWKASIPMFRDHPLGVGIKNFKTLVPQYDPRNEGMDPHNTYVMCYTEIGILGAIIFFVIIVEAILQMNRIRRLLRESRGGAESLTYVTALGAALTVYLCGYMMTHSILYSEVLWILLSMPILLENAAQKLVLEESSKNVQAVAPTVPAGAVPTMIVSEER